MTLLSLSLLVILINVPAYASELRMTKSQALAQNYKIADQIHYISTQDINKNSLPWPVRFVDSRHTIGNSMPQYQNYSNEAYYHGGADLRVVQSAEVIAPIDGFLQGDYYTYVTDPNTGEDKKYIKPINEGGDELYFEITITTPNGFLFEFHHIDAKKLPKNIYNIILQGGGNIHRGELIGFTSIWPTSRFGEKYDHIHYNIISSSGVRMNPEYYSTELSDKSTPLIKNIFAIYKNKKIEILNQKLNEIPEEIVVSTVDMKGDNIYPLPPASVEASWSDTFKVGWDFSQFLLGSNQLFPDIRDVYARNLRLTDGRLFTTKGDYTNTQFLFRLKIPSTAVAPITITVKDISGNVTINVLNIFH